MEGQLVKSHSTVSDGPDSYDPTRNLPPDAPDGPTLLNRFARCCKKTLRSEVVKNLAGLVIGTGVGATFGCPWVIGLLIAAGVGTSWMGGFGLALIGLGVALWTVSTVLSANRDDAYDSLTLEIGYSASMAVIGIPYVIIGAVGHCCNSVCCGAQPDDYDVPVKKKNVTPEDLVAYMSKMSDVERKAFAQRYLGLDLPAGVRSPTTIPQGPKLLSQVPGQLISDTLMTKAAPTGATSRSSELPKPSSASQSSDTVRDVSEEIYVS